MADNTITISYINDRILGKFLNHFQAIDINLGFYNITELQDYRDKYLAHIDKEIIENKDKGLTLQPSMSIDEIFNWFVCGAEIDDDGLFFEGKFMSFDEEKED